MIFYLLHNPESMPDKDFLLFKKLKQDLVKKIKEQHPEVGDDISEWKGREIQLFQDDLEKNVKGRISEKWFYTHLKAETLKLPRIDILDLLAKYVGYEDWSGYRNSNKIRSAGSIRAGGMAFLIVVILAGTYFITGIFNSRKYTIVVMDAYTNQPIDSDKLLITQLFVDESPQNIVSDDEGSFSFAVKEDEIRFVVKARYYHPDTIVRKLQYLNGHEVVRLFPNDYALMLNYLSNAVTDDWKARRVELSEIIADNAKIFQVTETGQMVLEMYTKHSFINKLTIPSKSLRNIEILDIKFEGEQISHLRFTQKKRGNNE